MKNYNIYSNIKEINNLIENSILALNEKGYIMLEHKNINYGSRYKFQKDTLILSFTIYYSDKKGISIVKDQNVCQTDFEELIDNLDIYKQEKKEILNYKTDYNKCIGTDEAGKGDYFGPLVVAGFCLEKSDVSLLNTIGVKDSKNISDKKIEKIYQQLRDKLPQNISYKVLMPFEYNKKIFNYRKKDQNLNDLLGYLHSEVILNLYRQHKNVDKIITDQFTHQDKVYKHIKDDIEATFIQEIKAENNLAVAAASIVARAVFLKKLLAIANEYETIFPKGASNLVTDSAIEFCKIHGVEKLPYVAKIHFKTTDNIKSTLNNNNDINIKNEL